MTRARTRKGIAPILAGFFVMGFVDVVGIATNYVKVDFALSDALANLLPAIVFLWFALFSIPTGVLQGKAGRRNTVAAAMLVTLAAMLIPLFFYRFASVLFAFALLGVGNTILQVSLNPMAASVVAPSRITGVLAMGQFIKAISSLLGPAIASFAAVFLGNWMMIFPLYAALSLLAALWLLLAVPGKDAGVGTGEEAASQTFASTFALCKDKTVVGLFVGVLLIVGVDVGLNAAIPRLLMHKTGVPLHEAGLGVSLYFAARTAGALAGAILMARYAAERFLKLSLCAALAAFVVLLATDIPPALYAMIVVIGLGCANVFPILFAAALRHKPERSNEVSALMIMGVSGGAFVAPLMGVVADAYGQVAGFLLPALCLVYLLVLSFKSDTHERKV